MNTTGARFIRILPAAGWTLASLFALYLIAGNVLLKTRLLRHATNVDPDQLFLEYQSAHTLFPGHAKVTGLTLRFQDGPIRFGLAIEQATVQISLLELARKRFHATRVRASGVSWRMIHKVEKLEGNQKRMAAFPPIAGFDDSPLLLPPPPGAPSTGEGLWAVRLDDVEVEVREVWVLEYRYLGAGHASGAFELRPMRSVWVGARLDLEEGALTVGRQLVAKDFWMHAELTLTPTDIPAAPGLLMLRPITASVQLAGLITDIGAAAELYAGGLRASGTGTLSADLQVARGRLVAGSVIDARLGELKLRSGGAGFEGVLNARLTLAPDAHGHDVPVGHAAVAGALRVPISDQATVSAALSGAGADFSIASADLVEGLQLNWLHARLGDARIEDASAITRAAGQKAPVIAPALLGQGPLVAAGTADLTNTRTLVWLTRARLGEAELSGGAAIKTGAAWNGAAVGTVAAIPIGLLLVNDSLQVLPFIKGGWLAEQLARMGIQPALPVR